jgi:hypothetical protein
MQDDFSPWVADNRRRREFEDGAIGTLEPAYSGGSEEIAVLVYDDPGSRGNAVPGDGTEAI